LREDLLFVVEGVFDAVKLHRQGMPAIAVLTSTPSKQMIAWLRSLGRTIIAVLDNDTAGQSSNILMTGADVVVESPLNRKDLGESTDSEVAYLVELVLSKIKVSVR